MKNKTPHTQGPWVADAVSSDTFLIHVEHHTMWMVAKTYTKADADLIAAAPDLLEALKELAFIVETVAHLQGRERELLPTADRARAAIARATGGSV